MTARSLEELQAEATEALQAYERDGHPEQLRAAAQALVGMRAMFTDASGERDWRGRTFEYRKAASGVYASLNLVPERLTNLQAALRYHIGGAVRELVSEEERERAGLLPEGPLQRVQESRAHRSRNVVTIDQAVAAVQRVVPGVTPGQLTALRDTLTGHAPADL